MPETVLRKAKLASAKAAQTTARARARGVRIAFGTDAGVYPHGRNAE
jgi:imidazolonepropionase-like amidohydrolase